MTSEREGIVATALALLALTCIAAATPASEAGAIALGVARAVGFL